MAAFTVAMLGGAQGVQAVVPWGAAPVVLAEVVVQEDVVEVVAVVGVVAAVVEVVVVVEVVEAAKI
jgi:hypothetical protein